jgi:hypothetical protein
MDNFVTITADKKSQYKVIMLKSIHKTNGPNAFPITIIEKETNEEVKRLDCCSSRLSASKSTELVANIFDIETIITTNTNNNTKSKRGGRLLKNSGKKPDDNINGMKESAENKTALAISTENNLVDSNKMDITTTGIDLLLYHLLLIVIMYYSYYIIIIILFLLLL